MVFAILALAANLALAGAVLCLSLRVRRLTGHVAVLTEKLEALDTPPCAPEEQDALERWNQGVAGVMAYEVRR